MASPDRKRGPVSPAFTIFWCAVVVAGATLLSVHKVVTCDEGLTLRTVWQPSVMSTWYYARWFELQPPVYFLLLRSWMTVGPQTVQWARAMSTLAAVGAVVGIAATVNLLAPRDATGRAWRWIVAIVALNPALMWAGSEARTYALSACGIAWSLYWFARVWLVEDETAQEAIWASLVIYVVVSYLVLLTNYYNGFVLLGELLAAFWISMRRPEWFLAGVGLLLMFLPWVPGVLIQVRAQPNTATVTAPLAAHGLGTSLGQMARQTFWVTHILWNIPDFDRGLTRIVTAVIFGLVVLLRLRPGTPPLTRVERALTVLALVPILVFGLFRAEQVQYVRDRHLTIVILPTLFCLGVWAMTIPWRAASRVLLGALVVFSAFTFASGLRNPPFDLGWPEAARWVASHAQPGEPILTTDMDCALPFAYYYHRYQQRQTNPLIGVPRNDPWGDLHPTQVSTLRPWGPTPRVLSDTADLATYTRPALQQPTFWVIVRRESYPIVGGPLLEAYLHAHADSLDARTSRGVTAIHWMLRP